MSEVNVMYETQSSKQEPQRNIGSQGGRQQDQSRQEQGYRQERNVEHSVNFAELTLRGTAVMFDIQLSALRGLLQLQARSAAAFGAPDYSDLLRFTDSSAKRLLTTGTEQVLNSVRQASDTITEVQRQFARLVEQGTMQITEEVRQGIEELNQRTQEGLQEVKSLAQQGADEAERAVREGGQQRSVEQARAGHAQPQVEQPRPDEEQERAGKRRSA
jgi:gas vesicle protein